MKLPAQSVTKIPLILIAIISLIVAVSIPAGYFINAYLYMTGTVNTELAFSARIIEGLVAKNPGSWQFEDIRLQEILDYRIDHDYPENRAVKNLQGHLIAEIRGPLTPPIITFSQPIYDSGKEVARIELERSITPVVVRTVFIGVFSLLLGIIIFLIFYFYPLRTVREAYERLREREASYRQLFENAPAAIYRVDFKTGKFLKANDVFCKYYGCTQEEITSLNPYDILTEESKKLFLKRLEKMALGEAVPETVEYEVSDSKGKRWWLQLHNRNIYDAQGHVVASDVIAHDITERKRAEDALRASEELITRIVNTIPDIIARTDLEGNILFVNDYTLQISGYSRDEIEGRNLLLFVAPEDRDRLVQNVSLLIEEGNSRGADEYQLIMKDGRKIPFEVTGGVLHNTEGAPYGLVSECRNISERKKAEEAIQKSEEKYRQLAETAHDIIVTVDLDFRITYANKATFNFADGIDIIGMNLLDFTQPHMHPIQKAMMQKRREGFSDMLAFEWDILHPLGKSATFDIRATLMTEDGKPSGVMFIARDNAERKKAAEAIQKSEQNYRLLASYYERLNNISISLAEASSTDDLYNRIAGSLRLLTDAIAATFSVYRRETQALKLVSLSIDPISRDKVSPFFGPDLFEMHMPVSLSNMELMLNQGIGRPKDLYELSFGVIPHEISDTVMETFGCRQIVALAISYAGEVVGTCVAYLPGDQPVVPDDALKTFAYLSGMAINRKQAEEAIRKSEERYRTIFESTATANIIVSDDSTIIMANHNFASLCGYTKQELEGKISWTAFIHKDDLEKMKDYHIIRRQDHGSAPSSYEFRAIDRKGNVLDLFMTAALVPETKVSIISMVDLTARKQLETQLIQSQKMESVGRLAGGVAHDFNNMLSVILGNTEMAMGRMSSPELLRSALQDIMNAGMRSADLTRQLLAFARKQTISPEVLDLNDIVTGMIKMLQRLIGENINLIWMPGTKLWSVKVDPSQIDQLLVNLVVNARDAMDKGGRIIIETSNKLCDNAYYSSLPEWVPGEYVLLAVSDNGCGMGKETLANIFEPFFTTKDVGQGTGLGLATVYGIVKQNNGFINVYSEPGQGTTFRIYLPRYHSEGLEAFQEEEMEAKGGTETILIVEDEESVLKLSKDMLEMLGYKVLAANKIEEALQLVREYDEPIDLLLTDVVMPDMNGKELSERITTLKPGLKSIYMSGYTADVITRQGILEEGVHFISKPFSLRTLAAKIRAALG